MPSQVHGLATVADCPESIPCRRGAAPVAAEVMVHRVERPDCSDLRAAAVNWEHQGKGLPAWRSEYFFILKVKLINHSKGHQGNRTC